MSRLFKRGELKAALLQVLDEGGPAHGYAVIAALAGRVGEGWRPSPGAVYPALLALEDDGLISGTELDGARVFQLTGAGQDLVARTGPVLDDVAERARQAPAATPTLGAVLDEFARRAPDRQRRLGPDETTAVEDRLTRLADDLGRILDQEHLMDDFARAAFREREAKQILRRRAFYVHAAVWAVTNVFLAVIWVLAGAGHPWFLYPLLGWGIGLVAHGVSAFLMSDAGDVVLEREQRRLAKGGGTGA